MERRTFLGMTAAALSPTPAPAAPNVKLGVDLFSIRDQGWSPIEYLDYCAKWGAKVVHFSEIRFIRNLEPENLKQVRAHAEELGIEIEIGMRSICPTSTLFDPKQGTAEEQLERMIVAAQTVGSKIVRCVLGSSADRTSAIPLEQHIENTVKVLHNVRSRVVDAGLKVAIENHAGDMQGRELKSLIEGAGPDFVGACLDAGNPLWTLEDPHITLEALAPYVLTSHVRDTAVWLAPEGVAVAWSRMGEGNVDIASYVRRYIERCPGRALSLEIIVTGPRYFNYRDPKFWDGYRSVPAWDFARFLTIAEKGQPKPAPPPLRGEAAKARQREDLEASLTWTKDFLATL